MRLSTPDWGLIVLIGASGAGKSTFARKHFRDSEILSSDHYRTVLGDDDQGQTTTTDAFDVMAEIASRRLRMKRRAVIDATNLASGVRSPFIAVARANHAPATAIVLQPSESVCQKQNAQRENPRPPHVVRRHCRTIKRFLKGLKQEGFRQTYRLKDPEEIAAAVIETEPLSCNLRSVTAPLDIIGDVHGCIDELLELIDKLGYRLEDKGGAGVSAYPVFEACHPDERRLVFIGDIVDRGPDSARSLQLVMDLVEHGTAMAVPGNHDIKLVRALGGTDVRRDHGLAETMEQLEGLEPAFRERAARFINRLPSHYELDGGKLVVAHAGMTEDLQGRTSKTVRSFAVWGKTTGKLDDAGLPVRLDWARDYRGKSLVVYGHTAVEQPEWVNNTLCIDTGCAYGGRLTALRYPALETVAVDARRTYCGDLRMADADSKLTAQQQSDELLDMKDLLGSISTNTRLVHTIRVNRKNTSAALETMIRFAVDPRWLIYLPPTMAPCDSSPHGDLLERPEEAFNYFRARDVHNVMCEDKHMGSRAVIVVCRSTEAARKRFGLASPAAGIIYTRTGRRFFKDDYESQVLDELRAALETSRFWQDLETDWCCLDAEVMPWSAKGFGLVANHYAPVAAAAETGLTAATETLTRAAHRNAENKALLHRYSRRLGMTRAYDTAYRRYNWPVTKVEDLKIAPFHVLATENAVHTDKPHAWHMLWANRLSRESAVIVETEHRTVDLKDPNQVAAATEWWLDHTERGAEGMVVKPLEFITHHSRGIVSPAIKCRGREYLRIIYGPEYTDEIQMKTLRRRSTGTKRRLALQEFALGIDALEKFNERAPLRDVHRRVFSILALETEPIDPRL